VVLVAAYTSDLGDSNERRSGYFSRPWDWADPRDASGCTEGQRRLCSPIRFHERSLLAHQRAAGCEERLEATGGVC
ncbi:unnamed protein product, partial [Polarella glacialis]